MMLLLLLSLLHHLRPLTLTAANTIDSFEKLFPDHLQAFAPCHSLDQNSPQRGICDLMAATDRQIDLLQAIPPRNLSNSAGTSSSCRYKDENGQSLHRYATDRSPELAPLLEKYSQMHRLCMEADGPRLHDARYRAACRYVTWSCSFGLGNRLMSLVSAFLYALLTQRVLLVENNGWDRLFCEPFEGSTWMIPHGMTQRYDGSFKSFSDFYNTSKTIAGRSPRTVPITFRSETSPLDHRFLVCPSALRSVRDVAIVNVKNSNQYFATGFFLNPVLQPVLSLLFPHRRVFHDLGRFLLSPADPIWRRIAAVHSSVLSNATRIFGVQIRDFEGKYTSYFDTTVPLCIQQKTGICPLEATRPEEYTMAVYVATMIPGHAAAINATLAAGGWRFKLGHQSADGAQMDDVDHQQKAVADMWLLSHADVLLTSGMSTFGYTAQGLAGITPYRLTHWPKDPCLVAVSSDPCFHFGPPRGMTCDDDGFGLGDDNPRGTQNVVWACRDFAGTGLQLVEP